MRKPDRTEFPAVAALLLSSDLRLLVCHGLTCLAVAGGRLLYPGDAQVEPLEASRIRVLLLHASTYPSARIDRRGSAIRVIGSRRAIAGIASRPPLLCHAGDRRLGHPADVSFGDTHRGRSRLGE